MDYIKVNKEAYDSTTKEFHTKKQMRAESATKIVNKLSSYLDAKFNNPTVIDLGPGNGQMARLLSDKNYNVTAIEFSEEMAKVAKRNAPLAEIIVDEFLEHDFKKNKYSGILASAFIHLFPKEDCVKVLRKMYVLLEDEGYILISTTKHDVLEEGLFKKKNFSNQPERFRRRYTKEGLWKLLESTEFDIIEYWENIDKEYKDKIWMNFIIKKVKNNHKNEDKKMELKGSQTEKNLLKSFAGESQARMRYDYFSKQAKKEGLEQISGIFAETALNEKEHAKKFFKYLEGNMVEITATYPAGKIGTTLENLKASAEGENEEWSELYPEFARVAEKEGFSKIAETYRKIAEVEEAHEKRFTKLYEHLEAGKVFKRDGVLTWKCRNCGYLHQGEEAPELCPACDHPKAHFEEFTENY